MKLVAPADLKGRFCSSMRGECKQLTRESHCKLYDCKLVIDDTERDIMVRRHVKCSACVDALTELGDR